MKAIVFVLIALVLISFVFLAWPLSPTLTTSFRITTPSQSPPTMEAVDANYNKAALFTSMTAAGKIAISSSAASQGQYSLTIVISYAGNVLSTGSYTSLGDGLYEMQVSFLPRFGEQTTSPYLVSFSLSYSNGVGIGDLTLPIYPT